MLCLVLNPRVDALQVLRTCTFRKSAQFYASLTVKAIVQISNVVPALDDDEIGQHLVIGWQYAQCKRRMSVVGLFDGTFKLRHFAKTNHVRRWRFPVHKRHVHSASK